MYDTIIIGSGPSGLNTALYTSRSNLKTLVIEKGLYGGQLNNTKEVENYIGVEKISGQDLADIMYNQTLPFGVEHTYGDVLSITKENDLFKVTTDIGEEYISTTVVIATGTQHRELGVQGELEYSGRGVSYCAICDGAFFKDKDILVVGGGDSALEEGEYLTNYGKQVTLIHRRNELRGTKILQDRFNNKENTDMKLSYTVKQILGDGKKVTHVELESTDVADTKKDLTINIDGVFIYVGLIPNTDSFKDLDILDSQNYVITNDKMETSVEGLYAVGDVRQKELRQIATAVGDGSICGTEIYKYIQTKKDIAN